MAASRLQASMEGVEDDESFVVLSGPGIVTGGTEDADGSGLTGVCGAFTVLPSQHGPSIPSAGEVALKTLEKTHNTIDSSGRPERGAGPHRRHGNLQWPEHQRSNWKPLRKHHAETAASAFLLDQVAALLAYDPGVRSGAQEAARAMMAAAGRVCLDLADHRRLLDATRVNKLCAELQWLTLALDPLSRFTPAEPNVHWPGVNESAQALVRRYVPERAVYAAAYATALAALESDRYFRLVADLQLFCSAPPLRPARRARLRSSG